MKRFFKKALAGVTATAIAATSLALTSFASITNANSDTDYMFDVKSNIPTGYALSDVYGAKFTISIEDMSAGAGGDFVFSSAKNGWQNISWGNSGSDKDLIMSDDDYSVTYLSETAMFDDSDGWSQIFVQKYWGNDFAIASLDVLDKDGNVICSDTSLVPDDSDDPDDSGNGSYTNSVTIEAGNWWDTAAVSKDELLGDVEDPFKIVFSSDVSFCVGYNSVEVTGTNADGSDSYWKQGNANTDDVEVLVSDIDLVGYYLQIGVSTANASATVSWTVYSEPEDLPHHELALEEDSIGETTLTADDDGNVSKPTITLESWWDFELGYSFENMSSLEMEYTCDNPDSIENIYLVAMGNDGTVGWYQTAAKAKSSGKLTLDLSQCENYYAHAFIVMIEPKSTYEVGDTFNPGFTVTSAKLNFRLLDCELKGTSVSIEDGVIGLNFYMDFSEEDIARHPTVYIYYGEDDDSRFGAYDVSEAWLDEETGYYEYTAIVNAKEMSDTVYLYVDGYTAISETYSYSVKDYAKEILTSSDYDSDTKSLVEAMLNYGAYAQLYFDYNTDNLANVFNDFQLSSADVSDVVIPEEYKKEITGTLPDGVEYTGSSLVLEGYTNMRHYFKTDDASLLGDYYQVNQKGDEYYILIRSVYAYDLGSYWSIKVGDWQLNYSAMSYAYSITNNPDKYSEELVSLVKSMYQLYTVAYTYAMSH